MRFDPRRGVQAEPVDVGTQRLARRGHAWHALQAALALCMRAPFARHGTVRRDGPMSTLSIPQGQRLVPGAPSESDAVSDGRRLQRPQRARLVPVGVGLGQVGLAHLFHQHGSAREHLHQTADDRLQQRLQLVVGGRTRFDEHRQTIGVAPVHAVQHQAVQVDVEVGGGAEALDQRDGAAVACVGLQPRAVQQMACDHALHHLQHRRNEVGLRGQQHAQRDRQRQHPLPHRHVRDDAVDQVRRGLRHPARAA
jgi:hypothetical protein